MDEKDRGCEGLDDEVTLDRLSGDWWIYQRRRGQRYSTDDVLTAWLALQARPRALRLLDLGAGIGSIGLLALRLLPAEARLVSVEILAESAALARRSIAMNGVADRVTVLAGDLRDPAVLAGEAAFDLVTANPPFLPLVAGSPSPYPARRAARFELHGDVFDSCRAAARALAPGGRFVLCHGAADGRPERAVAEAGLALLERLPIVFAAGRKPHLALRLCGRAAEAGPCVEREPLVVRDGSGARSAAYVEVLRDLGMVG